MEQTKRLPVWGRVYVSAVVALGALTILQSAYQLNARPIGWNWFVLALLTLLSGLATVKLPSVAATISVSETFVFTSVLLFGPAAGTLTVTLDVLAISLWLARRDDHHYRIAFNVFALPAALWLGAHVFYLLSHVEPLALTNAPVPIAALLLPLVVFTIIYFGLNSWLIAVAIWFETGQSPYKIWKNNFAILSLNYFGGASVAALLVTYTRNLDYTYIAFVLPLLAVLYFTFSTAMGRVEDANRHLSQVNALYMSTIETLAMAIDAKDQITHGHIRRVQTYAIGLAKHLGVKDTGQLSAIEAASLLHDMGKLAVPEYILNKPGPLTTAEFEKMKMHASIGADILSAISFPYPVVPIVRHHHENWNGTGYPDGLSNIQIPLGARILSVVDCFDALTSDRPYRPRLPDRDAIRILLERRGTMYDPLIVDTFIRVYSQIAPTSDTTADSRSLEGIPNYRLPAAVVDTANRRLDEISAGADESSALLDLAQSLQPTMPLAEVSDVALRHLRRLIPLSLFVVYMLDSDSDELVAAYASGSHASLISGLRIVRGHRLAGWVAANRQTIRNSDPVLDFGDSARAMSPRPRSALSTPLVAQDELIGVLSVYCTEKDVFDRDHERIIERVARQVADPLKRARDNSQPNAASLKVRSHGIPTSDAFLRDADASALTGPAALLLIKVSLFKQSAIELPEISFVINYVGELLSRALRPRDTLLRHDRDCLIVILPNTTHRSAEALRERLEMMFDPGAGGNRNWRAQVRMAATPPDGPSIAELLKTAYERMTLVPSVYGRPEETGQVH